MSEKISKLELELNKLKVVEELCSKPSKDFDERVMQLYAMTSNVRITCEMINDEDFKMLSKQNGSRKVTSEDISYVINNGSEKVDERLCQYVKSLIKKNRKIAMKIH